MAEAGLGVMRAKPGPTLGGGLCWKTTLTLQWCRCRERNWVVAVATVARISIYRQTTFRQGELRLEISALLLQKHDYTANVETENHRTAEPKSTELLLYEGLRRCVQRLYDGD